MRDCKCRAFPIPYRFENYNPDTNEFEYYLKVCLPECTYEAPNVEYLIIAEQEENAWITLVREEAFLGGWANAIDLPYEYKEGLYIFCNMPLEEEITYSAPVDLRRSSWEGFYKPLPVNLVANDFWYRFREIKKDKYGFWEYNMEWLDDVSSQYQFFVGTGWIFNETICRNCGSSDTSDISERTDGFIFECNDCEFTWIVER